MAKNIFINRFYHPDLSATSQMLTDLTRALDDANAPVYVICSRSYYNDTKRTPPARSQHHHVHVIRVFSTRFGRKSKFGRIADYLSFYLFMLLQVISLTKKGDTIIAKTDPPLMSIPLAVIAKLKRAHLMNWLQDIFPEVADAAGVSIRNSFLQGLLITPVYRMRDWSLKFAKANVVLSPDMLSVFANRRLPTDNFHIIPNWSDPAHIRPLAHNANPKRLAWGLTDRFVVAYSGNMGVAHDIKTITQAARLLTDKPHIIFLMIGDGARKQAMLEEIESAGLSRQFMFKPYQPRAELAESLGCADLHLVSLNPRMEGLIVPCLLYTSPSPRDQRGSRMPSSA